MKCSYRRHTQYKIIFFLRNSGDSNATIPRHLHTRINLLKINGESSGKAVVGANNDLSVGTIHETSFNSGRFAPICPEDIPEREHYS